MKQNLAETQKYYEAQLKDEQFRMLGGSTDLDFVIMLLKPYKADLGKVIDLGCGDGSVAGAIRAKLGHMNCYIGVEPVRDLAKMARDNNPSMLVLEADVRTLNCITGAELDTVLCLFLLQDMYGDEGKDLVRWTSSMLRKNGLLLVGLSVASDKSQINTKFNSRFMKNKNVHKLANTWSRQEIEAEFEKRGYDRVALREKENRSGLQETYWLLRRAREPKP
jgi:SAM-dependent methyltransferase